MSEEEFAHQQYLLQHPEADSSSED
jgi:hypothetical protein